MLKICVPLVPPSVNSYVRHARNGRHYVTVEARAFKEAVAVYARGRTAIPESATTLAKIGRVRYHVHIRVMLAAKQRLDCDNAVKVPMDALVDCGVIHSDAAVTTLSVSMGRDAANPRTEIEISVL